ncbi:hypothetical protein R0K20_12860, partial [Staphylococcus sp. SIMBA_130]
MIQFTKAINNSPQLHHLSAVGIVDRDRRPDDEVQVLVERGVHVLEVAEVENLILTPGVLIEVAKKLGFDEEKISETQDLVFQRLEAEKEKQIGERALHSTRIKLLSYFDEKASSESDLNEIVGNLPSDIGIQDILRESR